MYIGLIDVCGLYYLVYEIVDNLVDEIFVGFGKKIVVIFYVDGSVSVSDEGCGMFVGMYKIGKFMVEVILIVFYVGGKFG